MRRTMLRSLRHCLPLLPLDMLGIFIAYFAALLLRFEGAVPAQYLESFTRSIPFVVLLYLLVNFPFGLYSRLWKYASSQEALIISASAVTSTVLVAGAEIVPGVARPIPLGVVIVGGVFTLGAFTVVRYRTRLLTGLMGRLERRVGSPGRRRVLIVGAGEAGQLLAWKLRTLEVRHEYELAGFVDDDPRKLGMRIHGLQVLGNRNDMCDLVAERGVELIVIAIHKISGENFRDILSLCEETSAQIRVLPDVLSLIGGDGPSLPWREPMAEDLLGRQSVEIDPASCRDVLCDKNVLVTGAAGSIGSELCRQILDFEPRLLLMLDNNETALHDLEMELRTLAGDPPIECLLADILRREKLERIFDVYRPQVIFHSAAFKHVPKMEEHPDEAVWVNIQGSKILSELACQRGVERFVFISTDKAVNPRSVMGISKHIGEMLVTGLTPTDTGLFTAVRFGNVLGSRGSVVPTFNKQIELGGPLTITHPDAMRFFMTTREAASLVIQAAALTQGGDIFVLDMGQEIKIEDLARKMIRLHGLRVGTDVEVKYIGLRPGEKLQEELIAPGEEKEPTAHPRISRVVNDSHQVDRARLLEQVDELIAMAYAQKNDEIADRLRKVDQWCSPAAIEIPDRLSAGAGGS